MLGFHFFTLGALSVMVFYTIIQLYLLRKKEMLFMLGYLVFSLAAFAGQWHLFNRAMGGDRLNYEIYFSSLPSLSFICYLLFAHAHLNIADKSSKLHKAINYAVFVLTLYIAVDLYLIFSNEFELHLTLFAVIRALLIIMAVVMAVYFYRHYREEGRYFVAGTLMLLLGGIITLMLQHDFPVERIDNTTLNFTAPILYYRSGIILQSLFFLFGINKKIRQIEIREKHLTLQLENEQMQRELEKHKAIEQTRAAIASDLHDDIGATLSSINIYSQLAKDNLGENKETAGKLLEKISAASQEMMNNMSDVIWSIKPSQNEAENLADRIRNLASEFLTPAGIAFELNEINPDRKALSLSHEAKRNIYLVAKEALNNIIKYSRAQYVEIELNLNDQQLTLMIKDNGTGFNQEMITSQNSGNGLKNMKYRTKQSGGIFELITAPAQGTIIKAAFSIDKITY